MRFNLGLLFLLAPGCLFGWDSYKTDITQQTAAETSTGLDHLEPVDRKLPETPYLLDFILESSTGDQNLQVTLYRDSVSGEFFVRTRPAGQVSGTSAKVEIPEDIASSVYTMWVNALLEVRYDRQSHAGPAGSTDLFSAHVKGRGWLHGVAWNPTQDLPPKWMEDSAKALIQFTKDKDEAACRRTTTDLRDKLFAYLAANGKH